MRIVLLVLLILSLSVPVCAGEPLLLVTNEYDPYVSTSSWKSGFLYEVVSAAFKEAGIDIRIEFRPWRRCAMLIEHGEAFGAFPYGKTMSRSKYALFTDKIGECRNVFFFLKGRLGEFDFTDLLALRSYLIAGTSGHYYEKTFKEARLRVDYAPGEAFGIHKLWKMRTELFAEDELVGWTLIKRIFPSKANMFASTPTPWNVNPMHIMVSKKFPDSQRIMEQFNKGLAAIRANGTYGLIWSKYF